VAGRKLSAAPAGGGPVIVWFRLDLRLADNPALRSAVRVGPHAGIIPVYIWAPDEEAPFEPGAASRVWLHDSLRALSIALTIRGSRLVLRLGPSRETLLELAETTGARAVFWNRRYEPAVAARDARVDAALRARGLTTATDLDLPSANLLWEPEALTTRAGQPFRMFTPFWRACAVQPPPEPAPTPGRLPPPRRWPPSLPLAALGLRPRLGWDAGLRAAWSPGEIGARASLNRFIRRGLPRYAGARDRPDLDVGSRLSPHLHFGEIGPRTVWSAVERAAHRRRIDPAPFLRELAWREFAHHLLQSFPHSAEAPLRPAFVRFPWAPATSARAWRRGLTGYPFVDAGMRELWATGFMHNRVRMVAASFLVKHLLVRWQEGARHFWDTLVDADLADNTLGWQWCAGSGADAAPYFRIFNPVIQGRRFDPEGAYVRRWVPEVAKLPPRFIHAPWLAPVDVLASAGVALGRTYPSPMVDHQRARARALLAFATIRQVSSSGTGASRQVGSAAGKQC
jgi:deoxyribodipyrimidine photo-lyase